MRSPLLATLTVAIGLVPATAGAATLQPIAGFQSGTDGIALGPDGNLWVSETAGSVVRLTPSGQVLNRYAGVGTGKLSAGPGGRVWLADTAGDRFVWFDATAATPSAHTVPTGFVCGPVAIADGGDGRMYFSLPDISCGDSRVGSMSADGTGIDTRTLRGTVYDLVASGGKLYAPDADGDVVRRMALGSALTVESQVAVPAGGGATAVASDGTNLSVAVTNLGQVARYPLTLDGGAAPVLTPAGGTLTTPIGIVTGPGGQTYVTGRESGNLARIGGDGAFSFLAPGGQPAEIVNGLDEDLYVTDRANARVLRYVSTAPRVTNTVGVMDGGMLNTTVDPRGNDTTVVVDYGSTAALGRSTPPITVPAGVGGVPLTVTLPADFVGDGFARVRATNAEGTTTTGNASVSRMPPLPPKAKLAAKITFKWAFSGTRTRLTRVEVSKLAGGETIRLTCSGKGCPVKSKTYKDVKQGTRKLTTLFKAKHKLAKGAKVTVTVTKPGATGTKTVLTVRGRKQKPKLATGTA
ncbi:hypothetical protein C8N24_2657 [Solirubrobacter pauli]|uniref:NHL repeat-containing protein n=1 Tax=Solirubrobacter pauli TaxID=166793 RepID=A0A660LCS0_9ACTN|nr:hypothetical protein [Solirubrobacter pauli]RKQ92802.1 hypothetical protein C8N24_2657 [Solirubrobacter pauli]